MAIVSGNAKVGIGGLGRHLAQIVNEYRRNENLEKFYSLPGSESLPFQQEIDLSANICWLKPTSLLPNHEWEIYYITECFDREVASQLIPGKLFHGFDGSSMYSLKRARELKYKELYLEGGMSHILNVERLWNKACEMYQIEKNPLHPEVVKRFLKEYELADVIWVSSDYSLQTFVEEGVSPQKLRRRYLTIPERFTVSPELLSDDIFRIVYVGHLSPAKGIHILLKAFEKFEGPAQLILVGVASSENMKQFIKSFRLHDPRIRFFHGDPLPHLHKADVYVHPSYQEGFGYAPMEALLCGVPVIVTEDTGMKECVETGINGYVIPTGNIEAVLEGLIKVRQESLRRKYWEKITNNREKTQNDFHHE